MKNLIGSIVIAFFIVATASLAFAERQPHMHAALKQLQQAKHQLERASHDKGGHRTRAIQLIDQAIAEVKAGIHYDNAHPGNPKKY